MTKNEIIALFAEYGFTVQAPHTCVHTGNSMLVFYAVNDPYRDTACFIDLVTGEVEIDVGTGCAFLGQTFEDGFKEALEAARADIAEFLED